VGDVEMALLREVYSYWEKGDFRQTHFMQPDFELVYGSDFLDPGSSYKGLSEVSEGWRVWLDSWVHWSASAREYIQVGERILVLIDANLWEFRDGLASRVTAYARVETARREAGIG
jgi:hypothetical protein